MKMECQNKKKVAIYSTCDQSKHMFDKNHIHYLCQKVVQWKPDWLDQLAMISN